MRQIQRPQIAVENFSAQGNKSIEEFVEVPELFQVVGFVKGVNRENALRIFSKYR